MALAVDYSKRRVERFAGRIDRRLWMGIAGGVGIHGTGQSDSIGTRASHGCIATPITAATAAVLRGQR